MDSYKELDLPVPYHETFDILDSSKIQAFMDCPRAFFLNHVMGLSSYGVNNHLRFGSAWHEAQEIILKESREGNHFTDLAGIKAYQGFIKVWQEIGSTGKGLLQLEEDKAKNPTRALEAIGLYLDEYERDEYEVLFTETAGTVPISPKRLLHFKLDSVLRKKDGIWSMEHKTTGRNSYSWRESWQYVFQISAYIHALYALFGHEAKGVIVNGAIFAPKNTTFERVHVRKNQDQLREFLWQANAWVDYLDWNMRELANARSQHPVLTAFPKNTASCSKYGCKFLDICTQHCNPLKFVDQGPPSGYSIEFWDPRRNQDEADKVVNL